MRGMLCATVMAGSVVMPCEAVVVSANSTGGFGSPNTGWGNMVAAWTFAGVETVSIEASGTINLSAPQFGLVTGPEGITLTVDNLHIFPNDFFPLEEAGVEAGMIALPRPFGTSIDNVGALMAAFVPIATALDPSFTAADEDLVSIGIPATGLFVIGAGPIEFTAPGAGVLYVGVNDAVAGNNSGAFEVTVTVPAPATFILLLGYCGIGWSRRRR